MKDNRINLYDLLVELSGLDRTIVDEELGKLIKKLDLDSNNLSTEDIRKIATLYLFEIQSSTGRELSVCDDFKYIDGKLHCRAEA